MVLKMREKRKDSIMPHLTTILSGAAVLLCMSPAAAQIAPPTFRGDPSVYKLLYEDQNVRVISGTWAKGVHDKPHSHPIPSVAYALNDCTLRLYTPDGTTRDITSKAGSSMQVPITRSHTAENVGPADCHVVFVEYK
jgi:hypothetical protein